MYRIALASTRDGILYPGHFAHAEVYHIYELSDEGRLTLLEVRENPLGLVPDVDVGEHGHTHHHQVRSPEGLPLHGPPKYMWLRENVLKDVDVVIAVDACQTSYRVFTSQGVRIIFTDPVPVEALVNYIENEGREEFKKVLEEYFKE